MATKITENQAATVCGGGVNLRFVMQVFYYFFQVIYFFQFWNKSNKLFEKLLFSCRFCNENTVLKI